MRFSLLIAFVQFISFSSPAQNYYVQVSGDIQTQVADIAIATQLHGAKMIAYNTVQTNGAEDMHLLGVSYTNTVLLSAQFHLQGYRLAVKKILPYGQFVLVQKTDLSTGSIRPVIIELNTSSGATVTVQEMPALPSPYSYMTVYDFADDPVTHELRILCTATDGANVHIFELHYNNSAFQCTFTRYTPQASFSDYGYLGYVKHYHNSSALMGEVTFYASPIHNGVRKGFIFFKDFSLPYTAELYSFGNGSASFCVNGSSSPSSTQVNGITMVFNIENSSDICIQQKYGGLAGLSWRRFYRPLHNLQVLFGYGRGGHGTKQGGGDRDNADFFMGTRVVNFPSTGKVMQLRYNGSNGDLDACPEFNFTVPTLKTAWPNFTDDPGLPYYFVADRYNLVNGLKLGQGIGTIDEPDCTVNLKFEEIQGSITEEALIFDITNYQSANCSSLSPTRTSPTVTLIPECATEQREPNLIVSGKRD